MTFNYLHIEYANPSDLSDTIVIDYRLRKNTVVPKWIERVLLAQEQYPIDHPNRFYGFGTLEKQTADAINEINKIVEFLDKDCGMPINRRLDSVDDQDTLNYFHHIFEINHGLLGVNNHEPRTQNALSDLNISVHRCESIQRGANPRHVVTWFGLPKTEQLALADYECFETTVKLGTVYLNYVEIGKTLQDLAEDNDSYISDEAFRPFLHYSADFVVKFWSNDDAMYIKKVSNYYQKHRDFFEKKGYNWDQLSQALGAIPLADIIDCSNVGLLPDRQWVKSVKFT